MIEPRMLNYEDFPDADREVEGAFELVAEKGEMKVGCFSGIVYAERDCGENGTLPRTLQMMVPTRREESFDIYPFDDLNGRVTYPCIVFVQGSAWFRQEVFQSVPALTGLAARGYLIAIVEYRESTLAPFPAQIEDAKTAVRFLRANAEKFCIDPENIFLMGDSSGGHTAVMAGITGDAWPNAADDLGADGAPRVSCAVRAVIDLYGPTDITKMCEAPSIQDHTVPQSPEGMLIGGKNVLESPEAERTIVMNYIDEAKAVPPILMMHGTKDRLVPFHQGVRLYEKLRACGKDVTFWKVKGADHADPAFYDERAYDIMEEFLRAHMR